MGRTRGRRSARRGLARFFDWRLLALAVLVAVLFARVLGAPGAADGVRPMVVMPTATPESSGDYTDGVRPMVVTPTATPESSGDYTDGMYPVVSVVDGDTVKVRMGGGVESVRLIGIDAPETSAPGRPVQCFGPESSAKAGELLAGKAVRLEFDESQGRLDRFGRLLAYVWVDDVHVNERLVRQGYAREYTYNDPYRYRELYLSAQAEARAAGRGLWAAETCNGEF